MTFQQGFRPLWVYFQDLGAALGSADSSTPLSDQILSTKDAFIASLSSLRFTRLERSLVALLGGMRTSLFRQQGWVKREWHPHKGHPVVSRQYGCYEFDPAARVDHPYRLVRTQDDGKKRRLYVWEPYSLDTEVMQYLVELERQGWTVTVDAAWSLWFPGHTVRVVVEKKREA